jgi:1,4-dihydroxy-2-naphthoate polyprenyltransferase
MTELGSGRFVTFEKSNPEFSQYLLGSFSDKEIALPVTSLFVNTPHEQVTFQVLRLQDVARPSWWKLCFQVLRLDLLPLTLLPPIVIMVLERHALPGNLLAIWSLVALFFLHGAAFCRNDYMDHLRGVDRWNEKGGSRVIQRGWLRALTVRNIYLGLLFAAALCAVPVFLTYPELIVNAFLAAGLGVWGYSHLRSGRGPLWLSSLGVFLCLGPLLTGGASWVMTGQPSVLALVIGAHFGLIAMLYALIRQTLSMVVDDQASLRTLPVVLGFDRMKTLLSMLVIVLILTSGFAFSWVEPGLKSLTALPLMASLTFLGRKIYAIKSPLSSALFEVPANLVSFHLLSGLLLIVYLIL